MVIQTIKEFVAAHSFTQIVPKVNTNVNKYPFLTFINKDNKAENIYFSKASSAKLKDGDMVTKELLSQHQIAVVKNAAGDERIKLVSNSERLELADLLG